MKQRKQTDRHRWSRQLFAGLLTAAMVAQPMTAFGAGSDGGSGKTSEVSVDSTLKLKPTEASTFNDTNGDGLGEYQGWGTSLCWWANRIGYSTELTDAAAKAFFSDDGLDMNIGRYNVGGGDDVADTTETATVPVNEKADIYDLSGFGTNPAGAGSSMKVETYSKMSGMTYTRSDADFGLTKGASVGSFDKIGWINGLDDTAGSGDNLRYTVTADEAGTYTVKLMLTLEGTNSRNVAIRVGEGTDAQKDYVVDKDTVNNSIVASGSNNGSNCMLFVVTISDVELAAGDNTINIAGSGDWTLDFVKMAVIRSGDEGVLPETDEYQHASHIIRSDSGVPGYCTDVTKIDKTAYATAEAAAEAYGSYDQMDYECGYAWNYDWDADQNQINVLQAAIEASGSDFLAEAFSNSPPYFMTVSGCSSGNADSSQDNLREDSVTAFAKYMADVIEHWEKSGISFQSTNPMNEPYTNYWGANSNKQEGCHFDQGTSQSRILVALNEQLQERGITDIVISASDETSIDTAITSWNALSEEAQSVVGRIDTHTYSGSDRAGLKTTAREAGKNLWMSEVDGSYTAGTGAGEMSAALGLAQQMMKDVNGLKCSAWILWNAIDMHADSSEVGQSWVNKGSANDYLSMDALEEAWGSSTSNGYWGLAAADHDNGTLKLSQKYYAYGQFSRYIRPGYTIIGTNKEGTSLAAYDPDENKVVVVVMNTSDSDKTWRFDLSGFETMGTDITAIRTSGSLADGEQWADVSATDDIVADTSANSFTATLKANSITTYTVEGVSGIKEASETENPKVEQITVSADQVFGEKVWNNGTVNTPAKVVDGDYNTFFDGVNTDSDEAGYVILDLGEAKEIAAVGYAPRSGYADRCVGATVYASNDGESWTALFTIDATPESGRDTLVYYTEFNTTGLQSWQYIKYQRDDACNLSELKVYEPASADTLEVLEQIISEYQEKVSGKSYTKATQADFDDAIEAAQKLVDDKSTDSDAIGAAKTAIVKAYNALVETHKVTYDSITGTNGDTLYDTDGEVIQAHGGQIQKWGDTYYWYGEDKSNDYRPVVGVHLYTSKDLYNWEDQGVVLRSMPVADSDYDADIASTPSTDVSASIEAAMEDPYYSELYGDYAGQESDDPELYSSKLEETFWSLAEDRCVIERPKVLYNEATGKYVMWFHADGRTPESTADYGKAMAGVAVSDSPAGPFKLVGTYTLAYDEDAHSYNGNWDAEGGHVRDMTLFQDTDGTAYVLYSSEGNAVMYIARLNDSYTGLAKDADEMILGEDFQIMSTNSREAPAMFVYNGKYYAITSGTNGWNPTASIYSIADSPLGTWTQEGSPFVQDSDKTYASYNGAGMSFGSQATNVITVDAEKGQYIYMGDRWYATSSQNAYYYVGNLRESRYVWLPIEFGVDDTISIKDYSDWTLDELEGKGAISIDTEFPSTISALNELDDMPSEIDVTLGGTEYKDMSVTWSYDTDDEFVMGYVTATGTLTELNRSFAVQILCAPKALTYFADCYTNGENTSEIYTKLAEHADQLLNTVSDQAYGSDNGVNWGYTSTPGASGGSSAEDMGSKGTGDFYDTGWWATSSGKIEYGFELEPGNYSIATGFNEWWSATRGMTITVSSVDADGNAVTLGTGSASISSGQAQAHDRIDVTVPEGSDHILVTITKASGSDPVLSWIGIVDQDAKDTPADVDRTGLSEAIEKGGTLQAEDYTKESWQALQDALEAGQTVYENPEAAQEDVDAAAKAILSAMDSLVKAEDPGKSDDGKSDDGKSDDGKSDGGKSDPGKSDTGKSDSGKSDQSNGGGNSSGAAKNGKTSGNPANAAGSGAVKTGDTASTALYAVLLAAAAMVIGVLLFRRRKMR